MEIIGVSATLAAFIHLSLEAEEARQFPERQLLVSTGASFCFQCPKIGAALLTVAGAVLAHWFGPCSSGGAEVPQ